jgi:hypothetical protein
MALQHRKIGAGVFQADRDYRSGLIVMLKIPTQSITLIVLLASTAFNVVQAVYLKRTQLDLLKKYDIV